MKRSYEHRWLQRLRAGLATGKPVPTVVSSGCGCVSTPELKLYGGCPRASHSAPAGYQTVPRSVFDARTRRNLG